MIRISQKLLKILDDSMDRGWFTASEAVGVIGDRETTLETLIEGYTLGLYNMAGEDRFEIRREGLELLNIWRSVGSPEVDPWIDSRIYTMLSTVVKSGGEAPENWVKLLEERGFYTGVLFRREGYELVELVERLERNILIPSWYASELAGYPDGPVERIRFPKHVSLAEAMGLAIASIPDGRYIALTQAGRMLKRAFKNLPPLAGIPAVVNRSILDALEKVEKGEKVPPEMLSLLGSLDYVTGLGKLERRGRLVLNAYRVLKKTRFYPPAALTGDEEKLLKAVYQAWRERLEKTNVYATKERILKWLGEERPIGVDLMHLESLGLIEAYEEEGEEEYRPTELGEKLTSLPGLGKGSSVEAVSTLSKPISMASPNETWISEALDTDVLGGQGPTKRGILLLRASQESRYPFITREEAAILRAMPEKRSVDKDYLSRFEEWEKGVNRLVTRGLIDLLPDGRYVLTDAGRLFKTALVGVSPGIATPVYPSLIKVLEVIDRLNTDDPAEIIKATKLSVKTVKTALTLGRNAKYIGRSGKELTAAGKALLEAAKLMRREKEEGVE